MSFEEWCCKYGGAPLGAFPAPDEQTAANYGISYDACSFDVVVEYGIACHNAAAKAAWEAATIAERERCAELCDELHHTWRWDNEPDSASGPRDCAAAIRGVEYRDDV